MSDSQYAELIQKAKLAEKLERYEEMADCMKEAIELKGKQDSKLVLLPRKERDMLSVAYKKVVAAKRSSWKAICSIKEKDEEKDERDIRIEEAYKTKIEEELRETCSEVLVGRFCTLAFGGASIMLDLTSKCVKHKDGQRIENTIQQFLVTPEKGSWNLTHGFRATGAMLYQLRHEATKVVR